MGYPVPVSYTHLDVYKRQVKAWEIASKFDSTVLLEEFIEGKMCIRDRIPSTISIVFTSLRIPFALLFTIPFGVNGVWMSISLSSILKGTVAFLVYKIKVRREYVEC